MDQDSKTDQDKKDETKQQAAEKVETTVPKESGSTPPADTTTKKKNGSKNTLIAIISAATGIVIILIILVLVFGTPSASKVFSDMNSKMLETKSVTVKQDYNGTGNQGENIESIELTSTVNMDLNDTEKLKSNGDFKVDLVMNGMPLIAEADFITLDGDSYIKFKEFSTTSSSLASSFEQVEALLKDKWIKVRSGDNYGSFADIPVSAITEVLPTPFASLTSDQIKEVTKVINEESTYTIAESSKVELGDIDAYKYLVTYDKNQYQKFAELIADYNKLFTADDDSNSSEMETYQLWVNIGSKRIEKIQFVGATNLGNIEGTIEFTNYDKNFDIQKPDTYYVESELLQ
jgi:Sec-independent protein translocase protein TatA